MKAHAVALTFLEHEQIVRVPFFQRPYVWTEQNWEDLLADLRDEHRTHFLGSLIIKQQARTGGPKVALVIDGQQRLTTLSILLKALVDTLPETEHAAGVEVLRSHLFFKARKLDKTYRLKLEHSHLDRQAYEHVVRAGIDAPSMPVEDELRKAPEGIRGCYHFFRNKVAGWAPDERQRLFERLLDQEHKMLVVIDLADSDDEQAIFDTINSAGVRLSAADIIKNALFQRAIELTSEEDAIRCHDQTWKVSFLLDDDTTTFWSAERVTGRLKRDNIEILLHAIAVISGFYDPEKHSMVQLAELYKGEIGRLSTPEQVEAFARNISDYARLYREYLAPPGDTPLAFDDDLARLLHLLDAFDISTLHPFILFALRRGDEAAPLLRSLERLVVRRMLAGEGAAGINKVVGDIILDPSSMSQRIAEVSDEEVRAAMRGITNKRAALLLFWVELARRARDSKFDEKRLSFTYTLEHVMPQKWQTHWSDLPQKLRPDGSPMGPDEAARDRTAKVYWLGNMTLLSGNLNAALKNAPLKKKLLGDGRKKGMTHYASLSITRRDLIEAFEKGDIVWNEARIEARTRALEDEVLAIWGPSDR